MRIVKPAVDHCPHSGKQAFLTEQEARTNAIAPAKFAYHCQHCRCWHLTKQGPRFE